MNVGSVRSCKTCDTDDDQDTSPDGRRESILGIRPSALLLGGLDVLRVDVPDGQHDGQGCSPCDTKESETTNTSVPTSEFLEDDGKGGKVEIQNTINKGSVDGQDEDDWLFNMNELGDQ